MIKAQYKYLIRLCCFYSFVYLTILCSCNKTKPWEHTQYIRIINLTGIKIDSLEFYSDTENESLKFYDLNSGNTSQFLTSSGITTNFHFNLYSNNDLYYSNWEYPSFEGEYSSKDERFYATGGKYTFALTKIDTIKHSFTTGLSEYINIYSAN
jgi:hypothetical protein